LIVFDHKRYSLAREATNLIRDGHSFEVHID
jgi:hypothetical protein